VVDAARTAPDASDAARIHVARELHQRPARFGHHTDLRRFVISQELILNEPDVERTESPADRERSAAQHNRRRQQAARGASDTGQKDELHDPRSHCLAGAVSHDIKNCFRAPPHTCVHRHEEQFVPAAK